MLKKYDELEEKMKKVKEENYLLKDELDKTMKKVKEENDFLKDELNQSIIKRNACVKTKLVCDVSHSTHNLKSPLEKCASIEVVSDK